MKRQVVMCLLLTLSLLASTAGGCSAPTALPPTLTPGSTSTRTPTSLPTHTPSLTLAPPTTSPTATILPPLSGSGGGVIAFVSDRNGNQDIYLMNADGSNQRQLTRATSNDGWPSWSPDGARIVFHSISSGGSSLKTLAVLNGATSQLPVDRAGNKWEPAWSHDGKWIAFSNQPRNGFGNIFLVDASGRNLLRLTTTSSTDGGPVWSPDDSKIAFYSDRDGNMEVYVMNADGSDQRRLTDDPADDIVWDWSPDGAKISFASNRDGNHEIYVMNADGSNQRRLTDHPGDDMYPAWSPDGTRLVYASGNETRMDIFVMNMDGTDPIQLTLNSGQNFSPVWRPEFAAATTSPALTPTPADLSVLSITYICNDGFSIAAGGKKILIDALFHDSQDSCQADLDERAEFAQPPFDNADLVLVSHSHWDHFDPQIVGSYLLNNPRAILIAEKSAADALGREFKSFELLAERVHSVELARGQKARLDLAGVNVEMVSSPADVPNLGFLFQLGEFTFFHSGDSDMEPATITDFRDCQLNEQGIDFAFVPYWYLSERVGRSILERGIRAENYIPMHYAGDYTGESPAQIFSVVTKYFPQAILFPEEWLSWSYSRQ